MPGMTTWPKRIQNQQKRLEWLRAQPEADILPGTGQDVTDDTSGLLTALAMRSIQDGIYSKTSHLSDIRWGLRLLVDEIRAAKT